MVACLEEYLAALTRYHLCGEGVAALRATRLASASHAGEAAAHATHTPAVAPSLTYAWHCCALLRIARWRNNQ